MDSAAAAVATSSIGWPALTTPLRTSSPAIRSAGRDSPVRADSSSTAGLSSRPSTGTIPPAPTSSRSPGTTSSTATSTTPPSTRRRAVRGARSASRLSSRRARADARASRSCPLASITVITAPANGSPTARAPASASTAMTSTLGWWRRIAPATQDTEKTRPSTVPAIDKTLAGVPAASSHATPPASSSTLDTANSAISLLSRNRAMLSFSSPAVPAQWSSHGDGMEVTVPPAWRRRCAKQSRVAPGIIDTRGVAGRTTRPGRERCWSPWSCSGSRWPRPGSCCDRRAGVRGDGRRRLPSRPGGIEQFPERHACPRRRRAGDPPGVAALRVANRYKTLLPAGSSPAWRPCHQRHIPGPSLGRALSAWGRAAARVSGTGAPSRWLPRGGRRVPRW